MISDWLVFGGGRVYHGRSQAQGQAERMAEAGVQVAIGRIRHRWRRVFQSAFKRRLEPHGTGRSKVYRFTDAWVDALDARRVFVLLPFSMIAGLLAYRLAGTEPDRVALISIALLLSTGLVAARHSLTGLRLFSLALAFWTGFGLLPLHGIFQSTPMLAGAAYGIYDGRVDAILSEGDGERRLIVSGLRGLDGSRDVGIRRARIVAPADPPLASGDTFEARLRLYTIPGPVVPGGFDSQFHAYFDGIGAWGSVLGDISRLSSPATTMPDRFVDSLRREIGLRIDGAIDQPASGIARALTIGDQRQVDEAARADMQAAGLAHVLAISGLHLTLVAGGVFAALRMGLALSYSLSQRLPVKSIAAVGGILAALTYLVLSGASVSATRATITLILVFGAVIAGRRALTMRNVAIAAILVITVDPASVFRASFQLSFAAVVALIGVYELLRGRKYIDGDTTIFGQLARWIGGMAITSLVAGGATALFAAYHFQQIAPLGVIGNVLALPIVGFVVLPAAFLGVLAMPFGFETPFLTAMGFGIETILSVARLVSAWSAGIDNSPLIAPMGLIIAMGVLAWFAFFQNRWRLVGPLAAVPLILLFGLDRAPDVMIADTTQAVAIRDAGSLGLISGRRNSFAVDVWSEQVQEEIEPSQPGRTCDETACVLESDLGFSISLVEDPSAFAEDCRWADLIVTRHTAPESCRMQAQVIDAGDLRTGGVHWLSWDEGTRSFAIQPAITDPGRPWRPYD